jgi:hypothetical protein
MTVRAITKSMGLTVRSRRCEMLVFCLLVFLIALICLHDDRRR